MASITLQNLYKNYGKVEALRGISMDIQDGEFIAFLGPSGCGKSSTMRLIAGLEEITSGDILFNNESVIDKKPSQRNVSMAFETYALYPTLNIYENLAFPLRAAGKKDDEIEQRVHEVAEIVGITEIFDQKPRNLSSGQSQAVGLARALMRKPNVFLLDEPISHLDTSRRFQMRIYIKRLHIDLGYTMVLVTHDQEDAMALADRVAVMNDGQLKQIDTPRNIYDKPADLFVASFIGNLPMNLIKCRLTQENGQPYLENESMRTPIPPHYMHLVQSGNMPQDLVMGIRPYHLQVHKPLQNSASIPGNIFVVEPLGDMNVATVQVGAERFQIVAPTKYRASPHTPVSFWLDAENILLFDQTSGLAL